MNCVDRDYLERLSTKEIKALLRGFQEDTLDISTDSVLLACEILLEREPVKFLDAKAAYERFCKLFPDENDL